MSTPDSTDLTQQERAAARAALALFWADPPQAEVLGLLRGGYLNRVYLVQRGGTRYVLRRCDYNTVPARIAYEHRLLQALPDRLHTALVPKPIAARSGETIVQREGYYYVLFPFLAGRPFDLANPHLLGEAGRTLAAYHNAMRDYTPTPRQRPGYGSVARLDWLALHAGGLPALWQAVAALPIRDVREQIVYDALGFLAEEAALVEQALADPAYAALPQLVIHNDFGPHNLLSHGPAISGLLDFDLVAWDARTYDLAAALAYLSEDAALVPPYAVLPGERAWSLSQERAKLVLEGYVSHIEEPLTAGERALLPWLLRAWGLWVAIWALDLRLTGQEWWPEETTGLLACMRWLRQHAEGYAATILHGVPR
jgi:Ser/Thr protein kinase RdoA (MazF antagonist)